MSTTTQDQDHHILLDPTQVKQMVNALPKNQKHHHDQYEYADTEDLKTELNEFFDYNETTRLLAEQDDTVKGWRSMKPKEQRRHIHRLLTTMKKKKNKTEGKKSLQHQEQINAAKQLICLILCGPDVQPSSSDDDDDDRKLYQLTQTIVCINHYDGLTLVCRRLKRIMNKISASNNVTKDIMMEMDMYLTLAYLIIETRRQLKLETSSSSSDHLLDPSFIECLFCFIGKIQDAHVEQLPVRKMLLLLWKSMLVTFGGGLEHIHSIQQQQNNSTTTTTPTVTNKSTIQDYYKFVEETMEKYPGYQAPMSMLPSPLAVKATTSTLSAMGLVTASHQVDLPYQVFCNGNNTSSKKKSKSSNASSPPDFPVTLPLDSTGPSVPFSVMEANQIYLDHLHTSKASQQLIQQREQVMHSSCSSSTTTTPSDDTFSPILDRFEQFYKCIVPELQNVVVFFLKQLLTTIAPTSPCLDDTPDHVASLRNNQVVCKSISAILLLFLKWTKLSHVLKFEYTSQLLVDSGCILLILKIIGLQDVVSLVSNNETDRAPLCLFKSATRACGEYTNKRNMFWMINLLRVLQKLTKNKPNRVMIMVQYKSSTVFKKVLKISHPMMELYTLKILKSQVPFQTRKWRANNMKIISAIYMKCTTSLYDDWMGKTETDDDLMDGKAEEINIRLLARIYHGERYIPELLPVFDDAISETWSSSPSASSSATTYHRDNEDEEGDVFDTDELELDPSFVANYEIWLDDEVYRDDECLTIEVDEQQLEVEALQDDFLSIDLEQQEEDDDADDNEEIELDEEVDDEQDMTIELMLEDDDEDDDETCLGTPYDDFDGSKQLPEKNELVDPTTMDAGGVLWMSHHHQQQQAWTCPPSPLPTRSTC